MKTILLIEDDALTRTMMDQLLSLEGYNVVSAADGVVALSILESLKPDLVMLDLMLPAIDGEIVLHWIRGSAMPSLPVIVITAVDGGDLLHRTRELGVQGEFLKAKAPIDELLATVKRVVGE